MLPPAKGVSRVSASWRVEAKNAAAEQLKTRLLHGFFFEANNACFINNGSACVSQLHSSPSGGSVKDIFP